MKKVDSVNFIASHFGNFENKGKLADATACC